MTHHLSQDALYAQARAAVRLLEESRIRMARHETQLRSAAMAAGRDIDTRIDYARGSTDAYSIAVSTVLGAFGYASVSEMLGYVVTEREPLPPMMPDPNASQFAPGDDIAAAAVVRERLAASDTGE